MFGCAFANQAMCVLVFMYQLNRARTSENWTYIFHITYASISFVRALCEKKKKKTKENINESTKEKKKKSKSRELAKHI